jgi:hypothetical protein
MFSYVINNSNNFVIINDKYNIIPIGHRCSSALACDYAKLRLFSLPFDWNIPLFPKKIQKVLENNFDGFIPDVSNGIFINKYDIRLAHFNNNIKEGIEEYKRRIDRFNNIINSPDKKYFIYINEDYLYDKNYRDDDFNNNIFNEMLEFEYFIKDKYKNIDYNILYFNFKQHIIPINSNIINIVLHTTKTYNHQYVDNSPFEELRKFCGKILIKIFTSGLKENDV